MYENEQIANEIWEVKELGSRVYLYSHGTAHSKLNKDNKMKKLWLLAVCSRIRKAPRKLWLIVKT